MKAAVYTRYGPPDVVQIKDLEKPVPKDYEARTIAHIMLSKSWTRPPQLNDGARAGRFSQIKSELGLYSIDEDDPYAPSAIRHCQTQNNRWKDLLW